MNVMYVSLIPYKITNILRLLAKHNAKALKF